MQPGFARPPNGFLFNAVKSPIYWILNRYL